MKANEELAVFCPFDGDVIEVPEGITAPGWFIVIHENDDLGVHDFGVYVAAEVAL